MRLILVIFLGLLSFAASKINLKALTESMGQEVIEIGSKIKDLPPDLDEEPSAEVEDDKGTSTTLETATARETRRETTIESRRKMKDIDKIDNVKQEEDEARIEKELSELYKDTDYKADIAEAVQEVTQVTNTLHGSVTEKPIARMRDSFKFQPDRNNPKEVERFRTSIDDISCPKNKLVGAAKSSNSVHIAIFGRILLGIISFVLNNLL